MNYKKLPITGYKELNIYPIYIEDVYNGHEPFKTMWRWFKIFLLVLIGTLVWDNIKKTFKNCRNLSIRYQRTLPERWT